MEKRKETSVRQRKRGERNKEQAKREKKEFGRLFLTPSLSLFSLVSLLRNKSFDSLSSTLWFQAPSLLPSLLSALRLSTHKHGSSTITE